MAEKNINARIIHKHDTEANWNLATNFTPKQGEIIVYDVDATHAYERFKIGDGVTNVTSLPFVTSIGISGASVGQIIKVKEVDDLGRPTAWEVADQAQSDWTQNDASKPDYIKNKPVLGTLASKSTVKKSDLSTDVQESLNKADTELAKKVDKVDGKGLSANDYTTEEKNKLENITEYTDSEIQAIWDEVMT